MAARPNFEVVPDDNELEPAEGGHATKDNSVAADLLLLAVKALSARALVALSSLFALLTVASAFWVWISIPNPSTYQLVSTGMYALFILAVNVIVRRT